jgi:hypothetical protein
MGRDLSSEPPDYEQGFMRSPFSVQLSVRVFLHQ